MHKTGIRLIIMVLLWFLFVHLQSCIVDEYNIDRMNYQKDEWELKITAPLFTGDLALKDLVNYEAGSISAKDDLYLQYSNDSTVKLPASALFEPYLFLDKFYFLVADEYRIVDGKIRYEVTNGCPLPINLQLIFYQNSLGKADEIVLSPQVFSAAQMGNGLLFPVTTTHETILSPEVSGLVHKNRVGFISWFDITASTDLPDTLDANYRVKLKVILSATIKGIRDEEK